MCSPKCKTKQCAFDSTIVSLASAVRPSNISDISKVIGAEERTQQLVQFKQFIYFYLFITVHTTLGKHRIYINHSEHSKCRNSVYILCIQNLTSWL